MNRESRESLAISAHQRGYNCAQSVIMGWPALMDDCEATAIKLSSGFGGGMGRLQETCGAITGAFMVIGLFRGKRFPDDEVKEATARDIQEFVRRFREKNIHVRCMDLIGVDLNTPAGREAQKMPEIRERICERCIRDAVIILEDMLKKKEG